MGKGKKDKEERIRIVIGVNVPLETARELKALYMFYSQNDLFAKPVETAVRNAYKSQEFQNYLEVLFGKRTGEDCICRREVEEK